MLGREQQKGWGWICTVVVLHAAHQQGEPGTAWLWSPTMVGRSSHNGDLSHRVSSHNLAILISVSGIWGVSVISDALVTIMQHNMVTEHQVSACGPRDARTSTQMAFHLRGLKSLFLKPLTGQIWLLQILSLQVTLSWSCGEWWNEQHSHSHFSGQPAAFADFVLGYEGWGRKGSQ